MVDEGNFVDVASHAPQRDERAMRINGLVPVLLVGIFFVGLVGDLAGQSGLDPTVA